MQRSTKKNQLFRCLVALACLVSSLSSIIHEDEAFGSGMALRFGPPAVGNGGPNPLSIPPGAQDMEFSYITEKGFEFNLSAYPGLLLGWRTSPKPGPYVSMGGGLINDANGFGIGMYAGFGVDFWCGWICINAEFQQAIGITGKGRVVSPYAFRIGPSIYW